MSSGKAPGMGNRREQDPPPEGGYESLGATPYFRNMSEQLEVARLFVPLVAGSGAVLDSIADQHAQLIAVADGFYGVISDEGWVFLSRFNVEEIGRLVETGGADKMRRYLQDWFLDSKNLEWMLANARVMPEMRDRAGMLELAHRDTLDGRYYAAVQMLLSVLDGYVSDLDRGQRQGLHAKTPESMIAWDDVVGLERGLASALRIYSTPIGSLRTEPTTNLYRHGIVHGMVADFNNPTIAAKAWNLLAAVIQWRNAEERAQQKPESPPTWTSLAKKLADLDETKKKLAAWTARTWSINEGPVPVDDPIVIAVRELFDGWRDKKWGLLADRILEIPTPKSTGAFAGELRERFAASIDDWQLESFELIAPYAVDVTCRLRNGGREWVTTTKWFPGPPGEIVNEFDENAHWRCIQNYPDEFGA